MYEENCENSVLDAETGKRRCKITGYVCKPTIWREHGKSECIFEPKYLQNKEVKRIRKVIENIQPGMRVYFSYRMQGPTWGKTILNTTGAQILEIEEDGRLVLKADDFVIKTRGYTIHDLTRSLKLDRKQLGPLLQQLEMELENEEQIQKESGLCPVEGEEYE